MMTIMKKRGLNYTERGFTLLEVAIAIAIISIVFVSLISLFNTSIGITDYSKKLTKATFIAQKIMTDMEVDGLLESADGQLVELEGEYEGFSYMAEARESMIPLVSEVTLTVFFESVIKTHSIKLTTYEINTMEEDAEPGDVTSGG